MKPTNNPSPPPVPGALLTLAQELGRAIRGDASGIRDELLRDLLPVVCNAALSMDGDETWLLIVEVDATFAPAGHEEALSVERAVLAGLRRLLPNELQMSVRARPATGYAASEPSGEADA